MTRSRDAFASSGSGDAEGRRRTYARPVIRNALTARQHRDARGDWFGWIATGFALGSVGLLIWPSPGFVQLVTQTADSVVFLAESILVTLAVGLEMREATLRPHRRFGGPSRLNAAIQLVVTFIAFASINVGTAFGALCLLIGVVLLWRRESPRRTEAVRPLVPEEV